MENVQETDANGMEQRADTTTDGIASPKVIDSTQEEAPESNDDDASMAESKEAETNEIGAEKVTLDEADATSEEAKLDDGDKLKMNDNVDEVDRAEARDDIDIEPFTVLKNDEPLAQPLLSPQQNITVESADVSEADVDANKVLSDTETHSEAINSDGAIRIDLASESSPEKSLRFVDSEASESEPNIFNSSPVRSVRSRRAKSVSSSDRGNEADKGEEVYELTDDEEDDDEENADSRQHRNGSNKFGRSNDFDDDNESDPYDNSSDEDGQSMSGDEQDDEYDSEEPIHTIDDSDDEVPHIAHDSVSVKSSRCGTAKDRREHMKSVLRQRDPVKTASYFAIKRSIKCLNRAMRKPTDADRITAQTMPAVLEDSATTKGEAEKSVKISFETELVKGNAKDEVKPVAATSNTIMSSEATIDLDLDEENESDVTENGKNAKTIDAEVDKVERHNSVNGANDVMEVTDESRNDAHESDKQLEMVNGIEVPSGDNVDNHMDANKVRSAIEYSAHRDNGAIDDNEQQSNKAKSSTATKSNKRKLSISSEDDQPPPAKNLRKELESNLASYDKILNGMLEKSTSSSDPDKVQNDIDQLTNEIEALNEAARAKELEWNNILLLKKMKEDYLVRLNRQKTVMEIMSTKIIDDPENMIYTMNNNNDNSDLVEANVNFIDKHDVVDVRKQLANSIVPTTSFLMSRSNMNSLDIAKERSSMNSSDLAKEKSNISKLHRNIRPKSDQINCSEAVAAATTSLTNFVTSIPRSSPAIQLQQEYLQQRLREEVANQNNGANKMQVGRQGPIKDVKSLIDDFRQQHPEQVPRRGRRMKNINPNAYFGDHGNSSGGGLGENNDMSSPPSSNDSTYNNSQLLIASTKGQSNAYGAVGGAVRQSFGDLNTKIGNNLLTSTPLFKNQPNSSLGYPEVTLHPIQSSNLMFQNAKNAKDNNNSEATTHTNSLLHGILTKSSRQRGTSTVTSGMASNAAGLSNSFSPTLARLLTAPERNFAMSAVQASNGNNNTNNFFATTQASVAGMNLSKNCSSRIQQQLQQNQPEISCLPISQILAFQQNQNNSLLHQQLQRHQRDINKGKPKTNAFLCGTDDDEAEDSVDRLVIDEGDQYSNSDIAGPSGLGRNNNDSELPECQGCKKREAQFVCADCQRQWYCSRECQVMAWDEHSEVCAR